ncbi:stage II sporulation protein P [Metabacillus litoralis]|uniref:stage II sporulation protein P n=1 Tax=Metabacillus litoralis TaxID=152268 RepID=UPI00203D592A|nr:stage II sporulation protein P [Metabacillus litoralis]MCM3654179.1 stage II sporulation protein P [Metabacillus litoralis]
MIEKKRSNSTIVYLNSIFISIIVLFILASVIIVSAIRFPSPALNKVIEDIDANELFIHFLGSENHYFYSDENANSSFSLSEIAFTLATNIKMTDVRTLLGRELPGFANYDTEIAVAGEGTDFTNLPIESAPPLEVLLQEREIAQEKLEKTEATEKNENSNSTVENPPAKTTNGKKVVYIYHSHSWEAFSPLLKGIDNPDEAVSSNEKVNVIGMGSRLTEELNNRGIGVEHDKTNVTKALQQRKWNYNNSYTYSRETVQEALAGNDDLKYLIDIHRDSQPKKITTTTIDGKPFARLFFVVGKEHKNYEENLNLAKKINSMLEEKYPGISRGVFVKGKSQGNGVYNQDLTDRAVLLEFGGVENDLPELYNSIEAFAEVFSEFYWKDAEEI